ncbi:MAG: hypothetical protein K6F62_06910 [Schwartzia sp.]|nr:hypothetical protein [Schwartzia sp. (in: firmicutes)]
MKKLGKNMLTAALGLMVVGGALVGTMQTTEAASAPPSPGLSHAQHVMDRIHDDHRNSDEAEKHHDREGKHRDHREDRNHDGHRPDFERDRGHGDHRPPMPPPGDFHRDGHDRNNHPHHERNNDNDE